MAATSNRGAGTGCACSVPITRKTTLAAARIVGILPSLDAGVCPNVEWQILAVRTLFLLDARTEIVPFDSRQAQTAVRAWRKFGKGRYPAQLNLGDCCVYALAKVSQEPVLSKGADFPQTDIPLAT